MNRNRLSTPRSPPTSGKLRSRAYLDRSRERGLRRVAESVAGRNSTEARASPKLVKMAAGPVHSSSRSNSASRGIAIIKPNKAAAAATDNNALTLPPNLASSPQIAAWSRRKSCQGESLAGGKGRGGK